MGGPAQAEIEALLGGEDLDSWLGMWRTEQGPAKPAALQLIAATIPFPVEQPLRVLDLGCGPGDAGRAIHARFPLATVDGVDRNPFFAALCAAVHRREGVPGRVQTLDMTAPGWCRALRPVYDVVVAVNVVHWLRPRAAAALCGDIAGLLRPGGACLLMEPAQPPQLWSAAWSHWRREQPSQHQPEDWRRFWTRVQALVGHDYGFLAERVSSGDIIGDGFSVGQWMALLAANSSPVEVLWRDAEKVVLAAVKPGG